jgi:hypothetical protein
LGPDGEFEVPFDAAVRADEVRERKSTSQGIEENWLEVTDENRIHIRESRYALA